MSQQVKLEVLDDQDQTVVRGRPGRRTVEDRKQAVLELLAGKATVDQLARRMGVSQETVEGWREEAAAAIEGAFRRGSSKSARELELEKEVKTLKEAVGDLSMENFLIKKALDSRPTRPGKSPR